MPSKEDIVCRLLCVFIFLDRIPYTVSSRQTLENLNAVILYFYIGYTVTFLHQSLYLDLAGLVLLKG